MTYEQYWYDDPLMVRAFYKADKLRRERMDEEAWLHGVYICAAIDSTIGNAFRKNGDPAEYPKEPITITEKRKNDEAHAREKQEKEALWAMAWMESFVQAGKNWGKNKKEKVGDVPWLTEQSTI